MARISENNSPRSHRQPDELFIFRTDIGNKSDFIRVKRELKKIPGVSNCTIDIEDCDKVMRVECTGMVIDEIVREMARLGFFCSELED